MKSLGKNVKFVAGYSGITEFIKTLGPYGTLLTMGF